MILHEGPAATTGALTEAQTWEVAGLSRSGLSRFVAAAQRAVGLRGEVDILLADDRTLRRLNRDFRGKNKATDVLSFPGVPEFAKNHAGDLAISLETAARQAEEHGHSLRDEVARTSSARAAASSGYGSRDRPRGDGGTRS